MTRFGATLHLATGLIVGMTCLGCGSADPTAPGDQPAGARLADERVIDEAIAAVQRGDSRDIRLRGIRVTGADLRRMASLKSLATIDLGTEPIEIGDDDVLPLSDLVELRVLVLGQAPITDRGLSVVRGMHELQRLNVTQTRITDDGLAVLAGLPKLELLRIGGPGISDAGMARLKTMKQLRQLILVDCPLTDGSLPHLREMRHLQSLYLYGTRISEEGFGHLSAALKPHGVHLHD